MRLIKGHIVDKMVVCNTRRTDHFMGQLIEQCSMRLLKVMVMEALLTVEASRDSTLTEFTVALPKYIPICAALEEFALV